MKDIHGQAIRDHYHGTQKGPLKLHNSYGDPENMPVEVFFRDELDFSTLEHLALIECTGKILDIGAAAGAHALALQGMGKEVTALDNSAGCVEVMKHSGVLHVIHQDFKDHIGKYDSILMMMNGIGIAGKLTSLPYVLKHCVSLLNKGGKILLDSSDISYLYDDGVEKPAHYLGEIKYKYEYNGQHGDWFDWLYVDQETLSKVCSKMGLSLEILLTDENDQYLACVTR